ncbi:MAG: hypothetical protein II801_07815 [Bacteroidaceae bacterium]|nr:hypothetical protein [Bacteroidaceae bacterium]
MTRRLRFLWVWTLPLWGGVGGGLLSSCDDTNDLYHEYQGTEACGWQRSDTLTFIISPKTTEKDSIEGSMSVAVRTLNTYPYRTLPLRITLQELLPLRLRTTIRRQVTPDGTLVHADTTSRLIQRIRNVETHDIDIPLFDDRDHPRGTALPHIQHEQAVGNVILNPHHRYRFHVTHRLRDTAPQGITDVGIRLKR